MEGVHIMRPTRELEGFGHIPGIDGGTDLKEEEE